MGVIIAGVNTAVCTCFPAISARNAWYAAYAAIDASGALDKIDLQIAKTRMTQAGVIVADYNAIVVEMLENNAHPLAPQVPTNYLIASLDIFLGDLIVDLLGAVPYSPHQPTLSINIFTRCSPILHPFFKGLECFRCDEGKILLVFSYGKLKNRFDIDLVLVSGPNLKLDAPNDVRILGYVDNLHEYIYACDLVISLAGRSTIDESIVYGTPGIIIPIKNHFEQEGYKYEDISNLVGLIEKKLGFTRINTISNSRDAEVAAKIISEFL